MAAQTAAELVALARKADDFWREHDEPGAPSVFLVVDRNLRPALANRVHDDDLMWAETYYGDHRTDMTRALLSSAITYAEDTYPRGEDTTTTVFAALAECLGEGESLIEARNVLLDPLLATSEAKT